MQKYIYKGVILFVIFIAALSFMSGNIKEESISIETAVPMEDARFPLLYIQSGGYTINRLHGYSSNIDANVIREAVTPIDMDKTVEVVWKEYDTDIRKVKYEVRGLINNELLDSGTISALTTVEEGKSVKIKLDAALLTSTEYAMKITAVTNLGEKINFYTRIKYYETENYLKKKLDFIKDFHEKSLNKKQAEELAVYLETDGTQDDTNYAYVNIHSGFDIFSWGDLNPVVLTEEVPVIKEFNVEIASVQLQYFVSVKTDSGDEVYNVKEFYRIRYTADRIYLLNYNRTMEAVFDIERTSLAKSEFKLGITNEAVEMVTSSENNKLAFVRNGELWYYNLAENHAVKVFSFWKNKEDYFREGYDQHDVQILGMDDDGNVDFLVYGYMNRGDYEGKVAMILYHFDAAARQIREQVYIPLETTYQMLKEDIDDFSYVSEKGIFYFTMDNNVYSYNISSRNLKMLVKNIDDNNFAVMKGGNGIAWLNAQKPSKASRLNIMDLETEKITTMEAPEGEVFRIFGQIQSNLLYGYVKEGDITETTDGTLVIPAYRVEIASLDGETIKVYQEKNIYVTNATVNGNIANLMRMKKVSKNPLQYRQTSKDSLMNRGEKESEIISVKARATEKMLTESYISLPDGFVMEKLPKASSTENQIIKEDTTLWLDTEKMNSKRYYVYALGGITGRYTTPSDAIVEADEQMGVVVNERNQLVFERSGKFTHKLIGQIEPQYAADGVSSIGASLAMLLKYNQITASARELSSLDQSIYQVLRENLSSPINLTGCTLEEVLYFVSNSRPVIAMKDGEHAVLIVGYDESSVTYIDPGAATTKKESLTRAAAMFEKAGNVFISYMPETAVK